MDHTRDRDMGLSEYMPKPTIPMVHVNVVSHLAIGIGPGEGARGSQPD
jgi:hypothetical protein